MERVVIFKLINEDSQCSGVLQHDAVELEEPDCTFLHLYLHACTHAHTLITKGAFEASLRSSIWPVAHKG